MGWRGFGFVHHSRTLFCRAVPNPNPTIRHFCIAAQVARIHEDGDIARDSLDREPLAALRDHPFLHPALAESGWLATHLS
jgi:hypothetical protein